METNTSNKIERYCVLQVQDGISRMPETRVEKLHSSFKLNEGVPVLTMKITKNSNGQRLIEFFKGTIPLPSALIDSCLIGDDMTMCIVPDNDFVRANGRTMKIQSIMFVPFLNFRFIEDLNMHIIVMDNMTLYNEVYIKQKNNHVYICNSGSDFDLYKNRDGHSIFFEDRVHTMKLRTLQPLLPDEVESIKKLVQRKMAEDSNSPRPNRKRKYTVPSVVAPVAAPDMVVDQDAPFTVLRPVARRVNSANRVSRVNNPSLQTFTNAQKKAMAEEVRKIVEEEAGGKLIPCTEEDKFIDFFCSKDDNFVSLAVHENTAFTQVLTRALDFNEMNVSL
eukprot:14460-Hanusia_phi.AAC.3